MRLTKLKLTGVAFTAIALAGATTLTATSQVPPVPPGAPAPPAPPTKVADAKADPAWNGAVPPSAFPDIKPAGTPGVAGKVWGHIDPSAGPDTKPGGARPPVARVTVFASDTPLRKLQKARLNLLVDEFHAAEATARERQISAAELRQHATGLAAAAADVFDRPADLRPWVEAWVAAAKVDEAAAEERSREKVISAADLRAARLARVQAEIALAKLLGK